MRRVADFLISAGLFIGLVGALGIIITAFSGGPRWFHVSFYGLAALGLVTQGAAFIILAYSERAK